MGLLGSLFLDAIAILLYVVSDRKKSSSSFHPYRPIIFGKSDQWLLLFIRFIFNKFWITNLRVIPLRVVTWHNCQELGGQYNSQFQFLRTASFCRDLLISLREAVQKQDILWHRVNLIFYLPKFDIICLLGVVTYMILLVFILQASKCHDILWHQVKRWVGSCFKTWFLKHKKLWQLFYEGR